MRRTMGIMMVAVMMSGCASEQNVSRSTARAHATAQSEQVRADIAIVQAEAAIAEAKTAARLAEGVDSHVPGQPRLSDAEVYRRTALQARSKAHQYANLSNQCSFLAANVEDDAEKAYWRRYSSECATKSEGLQKLAEQYAAMAKKAAR